MRRREIPSLSYHLYVLQQAGRLCAMILERYEWQALYCVTNNTPIPPDSPPTLEKAARLTGRLGRHLGRKHDGMPQPRSRRTQKLMRYHTGPDSRTPKGIPSGKKEFRGRRRIPLIGTYVLHK